jgi:hypothetical protein
VGPRAGLGAVVKTNSQPLPVLEPNIIQRAVRVPLSESVCVCVFVFVSVSCCHLIFRSTSNGLKKRDGSITKSGITAIPNSLKNSVLVRSYLKTPSQSLLWSLLTSS